MGLIRYFNTLTSTFTKTTMTTVVGEAKPWPDTVKQSPYPSRDENKGTLLENTHVFYCYVYDDVRTFQRKIY